MDNPVLSLQNVSVRYQKNFPSVLEDVSVAIEAGSLTAVVGPNGSGKSTLMKAILGLIPYQGTIRLDGKPIDHSRHEIGYVPQSHTIDTSIPITVAEFLAFSHTPCPESHRNPQHTQEVLASLHAHDLTQKRLNTLSGGQLQRVLLARALMHMPTLVLLDEPEAGIDMGGEQSMYHYLTKLKQEEGISFIVASHEMDSVKKFADFVICLNHCIMCTGNPREVLTSTTFTKLYGPHHHS